MLKVVAVVDKKDTALDRLAKGVARYHDNLEYVVVECHPKRPDAAQLERFVKEASSADIIDWQYFRTAEMLRSMFPWLSDTKQILTHNNPYSIEESDWNGYDMVVANNQSIYKRLGEITNAPLEYIPLTVDADFWQYNTEWEPGKNVIMVANRIESKKGILPVAIACADLNLHFILVGSISDMDYFQTIMATGNVEFHEQISDEELRKLYHKSTIMVCNSVDNFESGTLPILEAMQTGVPVLTRDVGHVPDLNNGENMVIQDAAPEDVPNIQQRLLGMISEKKELHEMRDKAWKTAKLWNFERRAFLYQKLYRKVIYPDTVPVSIVVPIFNNPEIIRKCLNSIAEQTYKNIEVIIADDGSVDFDAQGLVHDFGQYINFPVRYIYTGSNNQYGLARARNEATVEATGDVMVYCDQRMIMDPKAVEEFMKFITPRAWLYGNKGGKKDFVENFSAVHRHRVIRAGLFSERITAYGGMSEEIRKRINGQGVETVYVESAKATPAGKSSNRNRKRQEIIKMKNRVWKMYDA